MIFSKEISKLQGQIGDLTGQLNAATGNVAALTQEKADLEQKVGTLEAAAKDAVTRVDHDSAIAAKDTEIGTLKTKLEAAEKNVDAKVIGKIAEAGVPAAVRDPKAIDNPAKDNAGTGVTPQQRLAAATKIAGK